MEAVGQAKTGWAELFREVGPKLLLFARQQAATEADAEDIVQEAFVRYWRCHEQRHELPPLIMFRFVKQIAIDHARRSRRRLFWEEQAQTAGEEPASCFECPLEAHERRESVERALQRLAAEQREVLVLKIWGELTFEQIAETLGIPANTAASRYRYALQQLKHLLAPISHETALRTL